MVRLASTAPFGPCWVGVSLDGVESDEPPLVAVIVTRRVRGQLCGVFAVVDRTCLGVKDTYRIPLQPEQALRELVTEVFSPMDELRECQAIEAQSVLFHALDYATSLGFGHHHDFDPALIEPRPSSLLETPLARPPRPLYVPGPYDDVEQVIEQLQRAVGIGSYDFAGGSLGLSELDFELALDDDFDDDCELEDEVWESLKQVDPTPATETGDEHD